MKGHGRGAGYAIGGAQNARDDNVGKAILLGVTQIIDVDRHGVCTFGSRNTGDGLVVGGKIGCDTVAVGSQGRGELARGLGGGIGHVDVSAVGSDA